jgi:hypothetical protein
VTDEVARASHEGSVTLGLIPAPDIPEKLAKQLASELPELLGRRVDATVSWDVPVIVDPLTSTGREAPEILDVCRERMLGEGWDLATCPYTGAVGSSRPTLAPSAGAHPPTRPRAVREDEGGRPRPLPRAGTAVGRVRRPLPKGRSARRGHEGHGRRRALRRPGVLGHLRLWAGMVLANRPWKMLPAFKGAIAAAFATGAYALIIHAALERSRGCCRRDL